MDNHVRFVTARFVPQPLCQIPVTTAPETPVSHRCHPLSAVLLCPSVPHVASCSPWPPPAPDSQLRCGFQILKEAAVGKVLQ